MSRVVNQSYQERSKFMKSKFISLIMCSLLVIFCFGCGGSDDAPAPELTGAISGTVSEISGLDASDVAAQLTSVATGATYSTKTDINGYYIFPHLPNGIYILRYAKTGFVPFNIYTIVSNNLRKEISGNLLSSADITNFFGAAHPYNSQHGLIGTYVRSSRYTGLAGATVSIAPSAGAYEALGYQKADGTYAFDWNATSTMLGYAMFYNVEPGKYTLTAAASGYTMAPLAIDITVTAGEITQAEFLPTKN
jgi:hypothetical protein